MIEILPNFYLIPANNEEGFGYSQFIKHPKGNVLIPRLKKASLSESFDWLDSMGGVQYVLISDRHFAGPGCREVAEYFSSYLYASTIEANAFKKRCFVENTLGLNEEKIDDHISMIPTPGHTPGQFSILVTVQSKKYFCTGDFLRWKNGKCIPGNLSKRKLAKSIEKIEDYGPDYIIGCSDYGDLNSFIKFKNPRTQIDEILATLTKP